MTTSIESARIAGEAPGCDPGAETPSLERTQSLRRTGQADAERDTSGT